MTSFKDHKVVALEKSVIRMDREGTVWSSSGVLLVYRLL